MEKFEWVIFICVLLNIFPDRIEIISPGNLPKGITTKNIGEMSSRRNEIIADMFARLDVVEKAGTGIIRIKEAMKNENLAAPVFENKGEFFKITLFRPKGITEVPLKDNEKVPRKGIQKLGATAQKILDLIADNSQITSTDIAEAIGVSVNAVKKHLTNLKNKELLKRVGPDKGGHWEIAIPNVAIHDRRKSPRDSQPEKK